MIAALARFAIDLRGVRQQIGMMAERYFEKLQRRNSGAYAKAYSYFYADMRSAVARLFQEDYTQSFPMEASCVPMMSREDDEEIFMAEKATFCRLTDFLRTEFYRALAAGNVPRRCHNSGRYFLLTAGYNTCYCGNIAPGETERTFRKVGPTARRRGSVRGRARRGKSTRGRPTG